MESSVTESKVDRGYLPRRLSAVPSKEVKWLVPGLIPRGEISVVCGDGGVGKGLYLAKMVAHVSTGKPNEFFPETLAEPGNILILAGEDSPETVLRPRLLAAGADIGKVAIITPEQYFTDKHKMPDIEDERMLAVADEENYALVILDPIQHFLSDRTNMNSRGKMRRALIPLSAKGKQRGFATILVCHTVKRAKASGRERLFGTGDLWDMARSVVMLGISKTDGKTYVSHEKSNLGETVKTTLFHKEEAVIEGVKTARAVFDATTDMRDADFVNEKLVTAAKSKEAVKTAILAILEECPNTRMAGKELQEAVRKMLGCSVRTYERAHGELVAEGTIGSERERQDDGRMRSITSLHTEKNQLAELSSRDDDATKNNTAN